eukprot:CAMPEP_0201706914 /NCGR_PEP_ID=MMETSP0578-20130828/50189_1 /ASSEMBLY_ACC=CAM_ASM_000663 /TAXON_ID=267565 /ORGANISM="Skeletonema grethea, Strain CCMP 1804" /LENGTH=39 /DNA_ID= /DNA_START= /DNA_END= /DNA_ORIENTATION=
MTTEPEQHTDIRCVFFPLEDEDEARLCFSPLSSPEKSQP